ncbi:glycoside hydrolase superfamily [Fusarium redolens]|uniref:beta-glucosidase n=1 Tax=Fusarium redolens TaxID=48865 RepID=A0A9P9GET8_FUSRE|nr:glycoside hydrolase superfamily [Fusarium redolens]KAH7237766.1 glycoside hydrolase superfamily [Fusarium redolens]
MPVLVEVGHALKQLTIEEKVKLLSGKDNWSTYPIERLSIPSLTATDGPHGARGTSFFNGPLGALLPSATAMGATFDTKLMRSVGNMLAAETIEKGCQILLAPTVCLQRSPLIGRGFEAFGEDPILSGMMASEYINGVQEKGVATSIKHYAAHDQSYMSPEDDLQVAERTLREVHLLPFQLAVKHANPWSFMTSYHRINGVHTSENEWLNTQILRQEWGWDGLLMSDWGGVFSTAEALNAGMDLEMPGPSRWRGDLLHLALFSRKVKKSMIDERVRNLLNLVSRVRPAIERQSPDEEAGDTPAKRALCREVARSSIVLLKNEGKVLPLDPSAQQTYGLIGPGVMYPAVSGGGSADLRPYYVQKPLEAIQDAVGKERVRTAVGCYSHIFTPPLSEYVTVPGTNEEGYQLFWYGEDPEANPKAEPLHSTTTTQATMYFADNHPSSVPDVYWLRVVTLYKAPKTATMLIGLCVMGKGRLYIDGKAAVDLWSSHPKKTLQTPMFNQASMELTADLEANEGQVYEISVLLKNESMSTNLGGPYVGTPCIGGVRIGCCEKIDPAVALNEAVELARNVDVPILIAGLNADYETEAVDRHDLELPPGINNLIQRVTEANPKTIIVNQSGCPVTMPWASQVSTLLQAWFGGQETGTAITDVLFGRYNPSGRLSITFPRRLEDTPSFLSFGKGVQHMYYGEGVFIGHRYYEKLGNDPLFYFGFGLSYTAFEYSNLQVPEVVDLGDDGEQTFTVSVDVTNTGDRDGHEIVQLYVSDVECATLRPCKELKGFAKVWVPEGGKVKAEINLNKYAVSYWDEEEEKWLAEKGSFKVVISRSADPKDEVLQSEFKLERDLYWRGV